MACVIDKDFFCEVSLQFVNLRQSKVKRLYLSCICSFLFGRDLILLLEHKLLC